MPGKPRCCNKFVDHQIKAHRLERQPKHDVERGCGQQKFPLRCAEIVPTWNVIPKANRGQRNHAEIATSPIRPPFVVLEKRGSQQDVKDQQACNQAHWH